MEHAKKLVLIDPRVLERQSDKILSTVERQIPIKEKVLSELDSEIKHILERDIPDDEKAKLYQASLSRYISIEATDARPTTLKVEDLPLDIDVIQSIPSTYKARAVRLLDHIKRIPDVTWLRSGELNYRGKIIPESHIVDLINDLLRKRVTLAEVPGWRELADALKSSNVPRDLIGNSDRWEYMHNSQPKPPKRRRSRKALYNWVEY